MSISIDWLSSALAEEFRKYNRKWNNDPRRDPSPNVYYKYNGGGEYDIWVYATHMDTSNGDYPIELLYYFLLTDRSSSGQDATLSGTVKVGRLKEHCYIGDLEDAIDSFNEWKAHDGSGHKGKLMLMKGNDGKLDTAVYQTKVFSVSNEAELADKIVFCVFIHMSCCCDKKWLGAYRSVLDYVDYKDVSYRNTLDYLIDSSDLNKMFGV